MNMRIVPVMKSVRGMVIGDLLLLEVGRFQEVGRGSWCSLCCSSVPFPGAILWRGVGVEHPQP